MAVGSFKLPISGGGGSYSKVVQVYTSSGTWTKPAGLTHIEVICIGGGGAGASGAKRATAVISRGGCGGGGGCIAWGSFIASDLSATEVYTVGAGGTGGAAVTTNNTAGNSGTDGGASMFGGANQGASKVYAEGGNFGTNTAAGSTRTNSNIKPGGIPGLAGAISSSSAFQGNSGTVQSTSTAWLTIYGGGGAGGVTGLNTASSGGSGARYYNKAGTISASNLGVSGGGNVGDGVAGQMNRLPFNLGDGNYSGITQGYGCPGGGGGADASANAGRGGDGGAYGGAGGGGGAARDSVGDSGRGGNGGAGVIIIIEHIVS